MWGYRSSSCTRMLSSLMLRNLCERTASKKTIETPASHQWIRSRSRVVFGGTHWSTDLSWPVMARSFLSSTVSSWSWSVLRTEKISCACGPPRGCQLDQTLVCHMPGLYDAPWRQREARRPRRRQSCRWFGKTFPVGGQDSQDGEVRDRTRAHSEPYLAEKHRSCQVERRERRQVFESPSSTTCLPLV